MIRYSFYWVSISIYRMREGEGVGKKRKETDGNILFYKVLFLIERSLR